MEGESLNATAQGVRAPVTGPCPSKSRRADNSRLMRLRRHTRTRTTSRGGLRHRCKGAPVQLYDHHADVVPYACAWRWQKRRAEQVAAGAADQALLLLQHEPTYTLGTRSSLAHVKCTLEQLPGPLYRTERGGEVTYHGPGQLVLYPVLDLRRHGQDLHAYMRNLEEVVITALSMVSGISSYRVSGRTGVWTSYGKIAAVGVRATRWVTYHGIALNVYPNLAHFECIVPCGISDAEVTSVARLLQILGPGMSMRSVTSVDDEALLHKYGVALQDAFQDVFCVQLLRAGKVQEWHAALV